MGILENMLSIAFGSLLTISTQYITNKLKDRRTRYIVKESLMNEISMIQGVLKLLDYESKLNTYYDYYQQIRPRPITIRRESILEFDVSFFCKAYFQYLRDLSILSNKAKILEFYSNLFTFSYILKTSQLYAYHHALEGFGEESINSPHKDGEAIKKQFAEDMIKQIPTAICLLKKIMEFQAY